LVCRQFDKLLTNQGTFLKACLGRVQRSQIYTNTILKREVKYPVSLYMDRQPQINPTMRMILVDWMADVRDEFALMPATMHLSIRLLDRLLHTVAVPRKELQLAGAACIMLASKVEESSHTPTVDELQYLCDNTYTHDQLRNMEQALLTKLNFGVLSPTGYNALEYFLHEFRSQFNEHAFFFANVCIRCIIG
jgi:hypothetical protein